MRQSSKSAVLVIGPETDLTWVHHPELLLQADGTHVRCVVMDEHDYNRRRDLAQSQGRSLYDVLTFYCLWLYRSRNFLRLEPYGLWLTPDHNWLTTRHAYELADLIDSRQPRFAAGHARRSAEAWYRWGIQAKAPFLSRSEHFEEVLSVARADVANARQNRFDYPEGLRLRRSFAKLMASRSVLRMLQESGAYGPDLRLFELPEYDDVCNLMSVGSGPALPGHALFRPGERATFNAARYQTGPAQNPRLQTFGSTTVGDHDALDRLAEMLEALQGRLASAGGSDRQLIQALTSIEDKLREAGARSHDSRVKAVVEVGVLGLAQEMITFPGWVRAGCWAAGVPIVVWSLLRIADRNRDFLYGPKLSPDEQMLYPAAVVLHGLDLQHRKSQLNELRNVLTPGLEAVTPLAERLKHMTNKHWLQQPMRYEHPELYALAMDRCSA